MVLLSDCSCGPDPFATTASSLKQSQVYAQVQMLFKDAPDLMDEFKDFLPEAAAPPTHPAGLVGILPQPTAGPGMPGSFGQPDSAQAEKTTKQPTRRRKRPEKEPAAPQKTAGGRVRARAAHRYVSGSPVVVL